MKEPKGAGRALLIARKIGGLTALLVSPLACNAKSPRYSSTFLDCDGGTTQTTLYEQAANGCIATADDYLSRCAAAGGSVFTTAVQECTQCDEVGVLFDGGLELDGVVKNRNAFTFDSGVPGVDLSAFNTVQVLDIGMTCVDQLPCFGPTVDGGPVELRRAEGCCAVCGDTTYDNSPSDAGSSDAGLSDAGSSDGGSP